MYSENSFKNYIFWLKVRRVFFMVIFSIFGALIGIALSEYFVNILLFESFFRIVTIAISTLLFFAISLLITATTGKEVQDGYWKIAVLRKLTVISKKLDALEEFDLDELKKDLKSDSSKIVSLDNTNLEEFPNEEIENIEE